MKKLNEMKIRIIYSRNKDMRKLSENQTIEKNKIGNISLKYWFFFFYLLLRLKDQFLFICLFHIFEGRE